MTENDANGHTEAATDLEKKIIKQIEVSKTIIWGSEPFVAYFLNHKLDLQAITVIVRVVIWA